jgi:exonuclease III
MDADVVLLQEVRGAEDRIYKSKGLMQGLRDIGYRYFYWNECADAKLGTGYSGVAVISKFLMEKVKVGLGGKDVEGRVITVYPKGFVITTAYTPCSQLSGLECTRGESRKNFDIDLKNHILKKKTEVDSEGKHRTFILMGDLNVIQYGKKVIVGFQRKDNRTGRGVVPMRGKRLKTPLRNANWKIWYGN